MSAAHHPPGSRADASIERDGVKRIISGIVQIAAAPGIADLATDIYACPSEHGNRRRWRSEGSAAKAVDPPRTMAPTDAKRVLRYMGFLV